MAVEVLERNDLLPFFSSATIKTGDSTMVVMFVNNQDDTLAAEGWRLMQRSEAGTLWSKPYDGGRIFVPLI